MCKLRVDMKVETINMRDVISFLNTSAEEGYLLYLSTELLHQPSIPPLSINR